MRILFQVAVVIVALMRPLPIQARWESARDNKSSSELNDMTNEQLFREGFDVCVRRAILKSLPSGADARAALAESDDYLDTVYRFVRERNGGRVPAWMSALVTAHTTKACQSAFRIFLSKTEKPAGDDQGEAAKETGERATVVAPRRPAGPKAATAQPHPDWTEQLPPWLAPQ